MKLKTMKNNFGTEFELKKNLENDLVPDEELDNVLTTGASIHLAEDAEAEVNDEGNDVESEEQEITKKGRGKYFVCLRRLAW